MISPRLISNSEIPGQCAGIKVCATTLANTVFLSNRNFWQVVLLPRLSKDYYLLTAESCDLLVDLFVSCLKRRKSCVGAKKALGNFESLF